MCNDVFHSIMIMEDVLTLAMIFEYNANFEDFICKIPDYLWPIIYQGEVKGRLEFLDIFKR